MTKRTAFLISKSRPMYRDEIGDVDDMSMHKWNKKRCGIKIIVIITRVPGK